MTENPATFKSPEGNVAKAQAPSTPVQAAEVRKPASPLPPSTLLRSYAITPEKLQELRGIVNQDVLLKLPKQLLNAITDGLVGRDEEALLVALSVISEEHAVLIGEPGTAKSILAERAARLIGGRNFEVLMDKFTEKEDVLGPRDTEAFRHGIWERIRKGSLTDSEIAFIDEIFNANGGLLNSLNSILNERKFKDANLILHTGLLCVIAATNELPEMDERVEAFYDRFLFRRVVRPVSEDRTDALIDATENSAEIKEFEQFAQVLYKRVVGEEEAESNNGSFEVHLKDFVKENRSLIISLLQSAKYTPEQATGAVDRYLAHHVNPIMTVEQLKLINGVLLPEVDTSGVKAKMERLLLDIEKSGVHIGDRRRGQVLKAVKARALIDGRLVAKEQDLMVLKYIAPRELEDFDKVEKLLESSIASPQKFIRQLDDWAKSIAQAQIDAGEMSSSDERLVKILKDMQATKKRVADFARQAQDDEVTKRAKEVSQQIDNFVVSLSKKLGIA